MAGNMDKESDMSPHYDDGGGESTVAGSGVGMKGGPTVPDSDVRSITGG